MLTPVPDMEMVPVRAVVEVLASQVTAMVLLLLPEVLDTLSQERDSEIVQVVLEVMVKLLLSFAAVNASELGVTDSVAVGLAALISMA